jgi:predicted nucleic acid-binding protein
MRTALDTNVLSAILDGQPEAHALVAKLGEARTTGSILVCGAVFAEAMAHPRATEESVRRFLREVDVEIAFELGEAVWAEAGRRFAGYAARRRDSSGGVARRLLADFIVGAHALVEADQLMTLDQGRYARDFPELKLV